jgi:hypothetical protein
VGVFQEPVVSLRHVAARWPCHALGQRQCLFQTPCSVFSSHGRLSGAQVRIRPHTAMRTRMQALLLAQLKCADMRACRTSSAKLRIAVLTSCVVSRADQLLQGLGTQTLGMTQGCLHRHAAGQCSVARRDASRQVQLILMTYCMCRAVDSLDGVRDEVLSAIQQSMDNCLTTTDLSIGTPTVVRYTHTGHDHSHRIPVESTHVAHELEGLAHMN